MIKINHMNLEVYPLNIKGSLYSIKNQSASRVLISIECLDFLIVMKNSVNMKIYSESAIG